MPLTPQEQRELDELELKELETKARGAGEPNTVTPVMGGSVGMFNQGGRLRTPQAGDPSVRTGLMIDMALEGGIPALGQAIAAPTTPAGQAVVGSTLSVLGNLLAQGRRMIFGEQENFSPGQVAQAGATGAIPFVGPAVNAARAANPVLQGAKTAGLNALVQGAGGLAGEAIKTGIDQGTLPTFGEAAFATVAPGTLGGAGSGIASVAQRYGTRAARVLENAETFGKADIPATPGMLIPEELGSIEQKLARAKPEGPVAKAVDTTKTAMKEAMVNMAPSPKEGAAIWKDVEPLVGKIAPAKAHVEKLDEAAKAASADVREAFRNLREVERTQEGVVDVARGKAVEAAREQALKASDEALTADLQSVLKNAREIVTDKAAGGLTSLDPASARTAVIEHVAQPAEAAFQEHAAALFSLVDNDLKSFNPQPILDRAEEITRQASGTLQKTLQTRIQDIRKMLGDEGLAVSLQDLRNVREELSKSVTFGEMGSSEQKLIKDLIGEITDQMDAQAVKALGPEGAAALKRANAFYRETRGLFDKPGVEALFSANPKDEIMDRMIAGLKKSGTNADEYKQLDDLMAKMEQIALEGPAAKTRTGDLRRTPEEIAQINEGVKAMRQIANEKIRQSILHSALDNAGTGYKVNGEKLAGILEDIGRTPGSLEKLGFGSSELVGEMKALFGKYPSATALSTDQWETLLNSPAFQAGKGAKDLKFSIEPYLAASQADNQIVRAALLKKAGYLKAAQDSYDAAKDTLKGINGDLVAAKVRYDQLARNPLAVALNDANLPDGNWKTFFNALIDSEQVDRSDLRKIVTAWRNGTREERAALTQVQARFIADKIFNWADAAKASKLTTETRTKEIVKFFAPDGAGDPKHAVAAARELLDPQQMQILENFADAAQAFERYEKFGPELLKPGSHDVPLTYQPRRWLDALMDLYRVRNYNAIAAAISDPREFARLQQARGERVRQLGENISNVGQGAGRALDYRTEPRR